MLTFEHFWVTFCCNLCKGCSLPLTMLLLAVFLTAFGCGLFIWDYFFTSYLQMGQNRKFENRVSREFIFSIEDETLKSFFHFTYSTWKNFTRNWGRWRERDREKASLRKRMEQKNEKERERKSEKGKSYWEREWRKERPRKREIKKVENIAKDSLHNATCKRLGRKNVRQNKGINRAKVNRAKKILWTICKCKEYHVVSLRDVDKRLVPKLRQNERSNERHREWVRERKWTFKERKWKNGLKGIKWQKENLCMRENEKERHRDKERERKKDR